MCELQHFVFSQLIIALDRSRAQRAVVTIFPPVRRIGAHSCAPANT